MFMIPLELSIFNTLNAENVARRKRCVSRTKDCATLWEKVAHIIVAQHLLKEKSHSFNVAQKEFVN